MKQSYRLQMLDSLNPPKTYTLLLKTLQDIKQINRFVTAFCMEFVNSTKVMCPSNFAELSRPEVSLSCLNF